ncbi:MAG: glycosyltransferase family 39 protein [bacterium]|nr:MAG: glycosyltransferase family 39 protein [bacterium]
MSNFGIQFTAWPEMLAWPYLMLQGWLPYRDIGIAHNPLLLLDIAIYYKIFGVGIMQLKIYTWILIAINIYLVYFVTKQFWSRKTAYFSTFLYLLLAIVYEGNGLWFDLALTPFAILLFYFLKSKNYLWTGIIFALGFLTKQTFVYFAVPIVLFLLQSGQYRKNILNLVVGSGVVITFFLILLGLLGILDDYYSWAIQFGIFYLPQAGGQVSLPNLKQFIFGLSPFMLSMLSKEYLILTFAFVGLLGVYPRWELFHFQPALPFLAIALSVVILDNKRKLVRLAAFILTVCFLSIGIYRQFGTTTRFYEEDVKVVVALITTHQPQVNSLYIINYWDSLYALTNTQPPKPLIPYIPWYLNYDNNLVKITNNLKTEMPEAIIIGERQDSYTELYDFVDKFYGCDIVVKKVEVCFRN